jgi:nuclear GTP-binding protein
LSKEYPTVAVHAHITKPFGKGTMIQLLRQFQKLHSDKQQISVGFIGYPNVGKSSIINMLRSKKVCKVAPIPGETKVWQYITLFKKIFLIDCPGVVTPSKDETEDNVVLKGVLRVENLVDPTLYIPALLDRCKKEYVQKTYGIMEWDDANDFLEKYAQRTGKLLKKGDPDVSTVSKMILNDWIRGKLPYYVPPPEDRDPASLIPTVPTKEQAESHPGLRTEPKKRDIRQPNQIISGLRVMKIFKGDRVSDEDDDDDDDIEYKSDIDEDSDNEDAGNDGNEVIQDENENNENENNENEDENDVEKETEEEEEVIEKKKKKKGKSKKDKKRKREYQSDDDSDEPDWDDLISN